MQLKSINKLEKFPPFNIKPDSSEKCENFGHFNLIYAQNGTGKTTVTRFMNFLSCGKIPVKNEKRYESYKDFNSSISTNEQLNIKINAANLLNSPLIGRIKVFNTDFISDNLNFEVAQTSTLFCEVGSENIELKKKKERIQKILQNIFVDDTTSVMEKKISTIEDELGDIYTTVAKKYRDMVGERNGSAYTRKHIKEIFNNDFSSYIPLSQAQKDNYHKIAIETPKQPINFDYRNITEGFLKEDRYQNIKKLLEKIFKRSSTSEKEDVITWLEKGIEYHKDEGKCKFCGKPLSAEEKTERFAYIKSLMTKDVEFETAEQELQQHFEKISKLKTNIQGLNFSVKPDDFLEEYREKATNLISELNFVQERITYIGVLDKILDSISNKLQRMDEPILLGLRPEMYIGLGLKLQKLQLLINGNNDSCKNQQTKKEEALEHIRKQTVFENLGRERKLQKELKTYTELNEQWNRIAERLQKEKNKIDNTLSNQEELIKTIETICQRIFGTEKFTFHFNEMEKVYEILRDKQPAYNISEGEKTVIAFAYFIASLAEKSAQNTDVIVIDDPISSLDQQYLFNLSSILAQKIVNPNIKNKQFFILTHNFFFFRKVRNYFKHIASNNEGILFKIYEIKKALTGNYIKNASEYLREKEGEYTHLINYLKKVYTSKDEENIPGLGNVIRQILEMFLLFKEPKANSIYTAFKKLLNGNPTLGKYLYLNDMANSTSHPIDQDSVLHDFDYMKPIGKNEIKELFSFMSEVDSEHADKLGLPIFP